MHRTLALAALSLFATAALAEWPPGDFGVSRLAGWRENPHRRDIEVRSTRQFAEVLHPVDVQSIAYDGARQLWDVREWYVERDTGRVRSLDAWASKRGVWWRWDLLKVPRQAQVDAATLRVFYGRTWPASMRKDPPRVTVSFEPWGLEMQYWTRRRTPDPGGIEPVVNGPALEWDVTDLVREAHARSGLNRRFHLVVRNMNRPGGPRPALGVSYRIPSLARSF